MDLWELMQRENFRVLVLHDSMMEQARKAELERAITSMGYSAVFRDDTIIKQPDLEKMIKAAQPRLVIFHSGDAEWYKDAIAYLEERVIQTVDMDNGYALVFFGTLERTDEEFVEKYMRLNHALMTISNDYLRMIESISEKNLDDDGLLISYVDTVTDCIEDSITDSGEGMEEIEHSMLSAYHVAKIYSELNPGNEEFKELMEHIAGAYTLLFSKDIRESFENYLVSPNPGSLEEDMPEIDPEVYEDMELKYWGDTQYSHAVFMIRGTDSWEVVDSHISAIRGNLDDTGTNIPDMLINEYYTDVKESDVHAVAENMREGRKTCFIEIDSPEVMVLSPDEKLAVGMEVFMKIKDIEREKYF